jgi:hypothetical protein
VGADALKDRIIAGLACSSNQLKASPASILMLSHRALFFARPENAQQQKMKLNLGFVYVSATILNEDFLLALMVTSYYLKVMRTILQSR